MRNNTLEHTSIPINGVNLHVVQAGDADAPLVILLHGFPDFWYGWRHQITALSEAGLRVWAPDQRGYNLSEKPEQVDAYSLDALAADVIGLIDAAGVEQAAIVGHDWGGAVTWWTANKYPERLRKVAIINTPHHYAFRKMIETSWAQKWRSAYMQVARLPRIPELILSGFNWWYLTRGLRGSAQPGTFGLEEMAAYRAAWSQPGALTAMLNWYRAVFRVSLDRVPDWRITVPTMLIWGAQDVFFVPGLAEASIDLCDDGRLELLPDGTHWVAVEAAGRVNGLLTEFLA